MHLQTLSLTHFFSLPQLIFPKPTTKLQFNLSRQCPIRHFSLKCSVSTVSDPAHVGFSSIHKPFPAEVSRTIMELSSVGTFSALTNDTWPLGVGVLFAVDDDGTPVLCLRDSHSHFCADKRSSLHVQLEQCGMRTPQCTIQGSLHKPDDEKILKWHQSIWKKRFGEDADDSLIYVITVERVLQMEDFMEGCVTQTYPFLKLNLPLKPFQDGVWVSSSDYKNATPDPLRDSAEAIVDEINANNIEDVYRFCNVYVDLDFQVTEAKMIWVDRLGFDIRINSPQKGVFDVRIPFPREVSDIKGAKSSFNGISQLAWEIEKNYQIPDFNKVNQLKRITYSHRGL